MAIVLMLSGRANWEAAAQAPAGGVCYAVAAGPAGDFLLALYPDDANQDSNTVPVGAGTGTFDLAAIAYDPAADVLYGVADGQLGQLDPATGQFAASSRPVGEGDGRFGRRILSAVAGLAFDPYEDVLFGLVHDAGADLLVRIDLETGRAARKAFAGGTADYVPVLGPQGPLVVIGIALNPADGQLYGVAANWPGEGIAAAAGTQLVAIDKHTGDAQLIGALTYPLRQIAFAANGALVGLGERQLYDVDPGSGATQPRIALADRDYRALTCLSLPPNVVAGRVYEDANANRAADAADRGTRDVVVRLYRDANANNLVDLDEPLLGGRTTDSEGTYRFAVPATGAFVLEIAPDTLPKGHALTTDNHASAQFSGSGQIEDRDNDFGHAKQKFKDDEVVVKFVPGVTQPQIAQILADRGLRARRTITSLDIYVLKTQKNQAESVQAALSAEPAVLWAELNHFASAALTPTDPDYGDPAKVYAPQLINAESGWNRTTGSPTVVVAVVDSGIYGANPEFTGRLLPGYDFVNDDGDPTDDQGHGTHVAGILAAAMNNGIGSTGIAPGVTLLPVKVLDRFNNGTWADIAAGITYAADHGADVINLSLGGWTSDQVLVNAIQYAASRGAFIVAAAGNGTTDAPFYPAYYPETFAVAATTAADVRLNESNYGPAIDIAAPGADIYSTYWMATQPITYTRLSGTSMAAPHVSGLAALLLSQRPKLQPGDLRVLIQENAVDLGTPGWDAFYGGGRIDVGAALQTNTNWSTVTATPTPSNTPTVTPTPTRTATPTVTSTPTNTPTDLPPPPPYAQRVNAGGSTFTDGQGLVWTADKAFATGSWGYSTGSAKSSTKAVNGTTDDLLYQKYREIAGEYKFTVPSGAYNVKLKLAEFAYTSGRTMTISMEGVVVESGLNVYSLAGLYTALDRIYTVNVSDGVLNILFAKAPGNSRTPAISAIEVVSAGPPTPTPTPTATITPGGPTLTPTPAATFTRTPTPTPTTPPYDQRVNAGGTSYTDKQGLVWAADKKFATGSWGYSTGRAYSASVAVANTDDDLLYQKFRELVGEYKFTVPNATYEVTLRFAEFSVNDGISRMMQITMEGNVVESGLSVYALAGKAAALDMVYTVPVSDGILNIAFARNSSASKNPAVSAIRVRKAP